MAAIINKKEIQHRITPGIINDVDIPGGSESIQVYTGTGTMILTVISQ